MKDYLVLLHKEQRYNNEYYVFKLNGETLSLNYFDACALIRKFYSKDRNCKISQNSISLKSGEGRLKVLRNTEDYKGIRLYTLNGYKKNCYFISNDKGFNLLLTKKGHIEFLKKYENYLKK